MCFEGGQDGGQAEKDLSSAAQEGQRLSRLRVSCLFQSPVPVPRGAGGGFCFPRPGVPSLAAGVAGWRPLFCPPLVVSRGVLAACVSGLKVRSPEEGRAGGVDVGPRCPWVQWGGSWDLDLGVGLGVSALSPVWQTCGHF